MTLSTSRQQFLACETQAPENIQYGRRGGVFISHCVCVGFVLFALLLALIVGVISHFITYFQVSSQKNVEFWDETEPFGQSSQLAPDLRLPSNIVPSFYRLKLKTDLENSTFTGTVAITIRASSKVKEIILHSKNLSISNNAKLTEQIYERVETFRSKREVDNTMEATDASVPTNVTSNSTDTANITSTLPENVTSASTVPENVTNTSMKPQIPVQTVNTQLTHSNARSVKILTIEESTGDRLVIVLTSPLKPDVDYILELSFSGRIGDSLTGFYKSTYRNKDNQTKPLGVTQFEPTSARAAFPCFDEPGFKARFEISIAHSTDVSVLSNMKVSSTEPIPEQPNYQWTHFDRSVQMSTYLVAYVLSDFKHVETTYLSKDNVNKTIRIWTRPEFISKANYALNITPKLLDYYEDVFGVPYALDKLDLIAIPDFSSGAMENWGLITFRETTLLFDEVDGVPRDKQSVAIDVAHELAHQWFGNLVTMRWWTDLWLNEGFATYIEYVGVTHIEPGWDMFQSFSRDKMDLLRSDALKNTSPVSRQVVDASEISQKFDEISYTKGANLIRMLNHTVSEELFHKGLLIYLNDWQYSNAEENDLWEAMAKATASEPEFRELSIIEFMNSWTRQAGYPLLQVNRNYDTGTVELEQRLFTSSPAPYQSMVDQLWHIPVSYAAVPIANNTDSKIDIKTDSTTENKTDIVTENKTDSATENKTDSAKNKTDSETYSTRPKTWLRKRLSVIHADVPPTDALYVNVDAIGYYRVNYDQKNWQLLSSALKSGAIKSSITKAQLIDDAFNLAKTSNLDYSYALGLTTCVVDGERARIVWDLILNNMAFLRYNLRGVPGYKYFQDYMKLLLKKSLENLNYGLDKPKDDNEAFLIENLLMWECYLETPRCLKWARSQFDSWVAQDDLSNNPIPGYLRSLVYSTVVRLGGRREFDILWNVFINSTDPSLQSLLVNVLPATRDDSLITTLLEKSLSEIPKQYAVGVWSVEPGVGSSVAQQFLLDNFERIYNRFAGMDPFMFPTILNAAFGFITNQYELDRLKSFALKNKDKLRPMSQTLQKLVDTASLRIEWIRKHARGINQWFQDYMTGKLAPDGSKILPSATPQLTTVSTNINATVNATTPSIDTTTVSPVT